MLKRILVFLAVISLAMAQSFDYVGTDGCKMCHKSAKKGDQYGKWMSGPHATAFETLKSEESAKIAAEKGITGPAYEAAECLVCHATGFGDGGYEVMAAEFWAEVTDKGKPTKAVKRMTGLQPVSCESCHGAGSKYKSMKTMKAITAGEIDGATVGLIEPLEAVCVTCHNEKSPTYKPFDFSVRVKEIAHPYPPAE